jgi:hypothetical protein
LWANGGVKDLNDLIPPDSGWKLVDAYAINGSGQIVGAGYKDGLLQAFLLHPVYDFSGFFAPVDNPDVMNRIQAGSAVPVKFGLAGDQGLDIFAEGYPRSRLIGCDSAAPVDNIEQTVSAGESGLTYDATADQYTYVWKTSKAWGATCRQLVAKLDDGTVHQANFRFK